MLPIRAKLPANFCFLFLLITVTFIDFTRVSPPGGFHPHFLPVRPRLSTILSKFVHNFFRSGVTSPRRVSPGAVPPPPSDATGDESPKQGPVAYWQNPDGGLRRKAPKAENQRVKRVLVTLCPCD